MKRTVNGHIILCRSFSCVVIYVFFSSLSFIYGYLCVLRNSFFSSHMYTSCPSLSRSIIVKLKQDIINLNEKKKPL